MPSINHYPLSLTLLLLLVVFDDGDERTLKRSSLCLKGGRHFHESEVSSTLSLPRCACVIPSPAQSLDKMPLTDPENFGTPVLMQVSVALTVHYCP